MKNVFETAKQNDCCVKFTSVYFSSVERAYRQIFGIPPWLARNSFLFNVRACLTEISVEKSIDELKINNNLTSQEFARKNINFLDKRHFQNRKIYLFVCRIKYHLHWYNNSSQWHFRNYFCQKMRQVFARIFKFKITKNYLYSNFIFRHIFLSHLYNISFVNLSSQSNRFQFEFAKRYSKKTSPRTLAQQIAFWRIFF